MQPYSSRCNSQTSTFASSGSLLEMQNLRGATSYLWNQNLHLIRSLDYWCVQWSLGSTCVIGLIWSGFRWLFFLSAGHCMFQKYQTYLRGSILFNTVLLANTSLFFKDLSLEQFPLWSFPLSLPRQLILPSSDDFHCVWITLVLKLLLYLLLSSLRL